MVVRKRSLFAHMFFLSLSLSLSLHLGRTIGVPKEFLWNSFGSPVYRCVNVYGVGATREKALTPAAPDRCCLVALKKGLEKLK